MYEVLNPWAEADEAKKEGRVLSAGDLQETQMLFYKQGWTDGLPILPPTEEAVAEMLTGTDLAPDSVVAKIGPRNGKATVEKIAINAVMAGCIPTFMPVLIAGAQALADPSSGFDIYGTSTGSWAPLWILSGPIRNEVKANNSSGMLSPGNIANASIGRAMGLIIKNIGGIRKGIEDMGTLGCSGKYTAVIAENEEESPWEPYHVERGYAKEDSCVSLTFPNSFHPTRPYGTDEKGILRGVISNLVPSAGGLTLVLIPTQAQTLAEAGWTKKELVSYIAEYARHPSYRTATHWKGIERLAEAAAKGAASAPPALNAEDSVRVTAPDSIRVIVGGGPGQFFNLIHGAGAKVCTTKKLALPAKWESLVRKYRDMVPNHVRY